MRDGDKGRLLGKGVLKAVANVNDIIAAKLVGMDVTKQTEIDKMMVETLDGTTNEWGWSNQSWAPTPSWPFPWLSAEQVPL